jgi:hypothetical protein
VTAQNFDATNEEMAFMIDGTSFISTGQAGVANNFFVGLNAGNITLTGIQNTALGEDSLSSLTGTGSDARNNLAIGWESGKANTTGQSNVYIGSQAGRNCTTSNNNFLFGLQTGRNLTGGNNTMIGTQIAAGASTSTANGNTIIGAEAGAALLTAEFCVAIGSQALKTETGSDGSTAVGYKALTLNDTITGNARNTAIGWSALQTLDAGTQNVAVGALAGSVAGPGPTGGLQAHNNTFIGYSAALTASNVDKCICIGHKNELPIQTGVGRDNQLCIGNLIFGTGLSASGVPSGTTTNIAGLLGIGEIAPSAKLHITQGETAAAIPALELEQLDVSEPFINFVGTATADANSSISTLNTSGATTDHIQIDLNGTKAWIAVSTNAPT